MTTDQRLAEEYAKEWFNEPLVQARAKVDFTAGRESLRAELKLSDEENEVIMLLKQYGFLNDNLRRRYIEKLLAIIDRLTGEGSAK